GRQLGASADRVRADVEKKMSKDHRRAEAASGRECRQRGIAILRRLAGPAAAVIILIAGRADAAISEHDLQAKMAYCKTCHGVAGRGFRGGFYPIPRLAGQPIKYIEN